MTRHPFAFVTIVVTVGALVGAALWLWTPDRSRAELEAKYLRSPGDMIDVAGDRLHVRDNGPRGAPAIILIHGFGSSLHTWEPWARALEGTYRVVRFDLPGAGLSVPDSRDDYTDARTIEVLAALMDRLGIPKAVLVGHSIGGRIAWRFAADHPDRVTKLVLIAPDGFASPGRSYGQTEKVPALAKLMRFVLPRPFLRMNLAPAYGDPSKLDEATVDRYYDLMLAPQVRDAMIARMEQAVLVPPEPLLRTIAIPVLLLWGEKDGMIPVRNATDYLKALPNGALVSLPGLGHVPHEEAPDASLAPVKAFLDTGCQDQPCEGR